MKLVVAAVLAVATLSSGSVVKSGDDGSFELLILHNNDMHARFEQTSQSSGACNTEDREAGKCYGGFPRVAHVVKEARRAAQSGEGPPVLYLNAGDTYTGTAWFTLYKWKIAAEFINAIQPDAVALGNNELDKDGKLLPFLENIKTEIVASNVIIKSAVNITIHKSLMFVIQGVKVGVIGYLTPEAKMLDSFGDVEYIDEVLALKEEVATLKSLNVEIIIALGHATPSKDIEIAKEVDGIDLVIAGNKNAFYWNGNTVSDNDKTKIITQESGKQVPVILSTAYDKYLGSIKIKFDANGEIIDYNANPILLESSIPQDVESLTVAEKYHAEIDSRLEEVVGNTAVVLDGDSCSFEECNLGNLVTDAIMYYYATRFEGENWTDAPVALLHGGAIAASIAPSNRPAAVTRGDLQSALPLASNIVAVSMNGVLLYQVLEHSVADYSQKNPTGQFLQFSGIRVVYDMSQEAGSRVSHVVVRCWSCFVPEFYTIDDWRTYKLLVPAALADGEYGYSMLVGLPREELEFDEVTSVEDYINLRSPVYPEVASRVVLNNVDSVDAPGVDAPGVDAPGSASSLGFSVLSLALVPALIFFN